MDAITFFALFAVAAAAALFVAAAVVASVVWAGVAIASRLLRERDARFTPGLRASAQRLHAMKVD